MAARKPPDEMESVDAETDKEGSSGSEAERGDDTETVEERMIIGA
jgi:hypothetical protein